MTDLPSHIMTKVTIDDTTGCWLWQGGMNGAVPQFNTIGHKVVNVRRVLYEHYVGEPPRNVRVACGNPRCVNPAHVAQPKTHACRAYWECQKCAKSEKPIDRLRRLAKRCGFELVPVGKNRWHVVLDMS